MSLVTLEKITAGYGRNIVIDEVSVQIEEGELVGILGANGSGKSTLAKAVCNLLPHEGNVVICGQEVEKLSAKAAAGLISFIPQQSGIGMDISVLDVVMMGFNARLKLLENPNRSMVEKAKKMIERVGLAGKCHTNYMLLSEGQKKLVILARALVSEGNFLVMDEPESALDFNVKYKMMEIIREWILEGSRAGLVILHDAQLALNQCDRILLLREKKVVGVIDRKNDTLEEVEEKLGRVYENICAAKVKSRNGQESLVMICDSEGL